MLILSLHLITGVSLSSPCQHAQEACKVVLASFILKFLQLHSIAPIEAGVLLAGWLLSYMEKVFLSWPMMHIYDSLSAGEQYNVRFPL